MASRIVAVGCVAHNSTTTPSSSACGHFLFPQAGRANPSLIASSKGVNGQTNCSPSAVPVRLLLSSIMPSFYARPPPGLPITPPESMYYHQYAMYGMHDQKGAFDSYNQMQQYHPGYRQQGLQFPPGLAHPTNCNTLPPLHGMKSDENMQLPWNARNDANKSAPAKTEEKPTGGVAQVLDYEIEDMAEFVTSMAIGIILPGSQSQQTISAFKKFVFTILQSTRLPSSTVILSLDYLSHRMNNCPPTTQQKGLPHLYRMCTISLLLASKFLDDNTFQNRSWADVTGLQVTELNQLEADWLAAIGWQLHVARPGYTGFDSWKASWDSFISQKQVHHAPVLTPINTNINNRRHTMSFTNQTFSPQQQHPQSALPHGYIGDHLRQSQMNDGAYWCPDLTSSAQPSPPSLASSGPATPAWEFPINNWGHHFGGKHQFPARVSPSRISPPLIMQGFKGACNCVTCFHSRIPQLPTPSIYSGFALGYGHQIVA